MDGYGYHLTSLSCLTLVPPQLAASHPPEVENVTRYYPWGGSGKCQTFQI